MPRIGDERREKARAARRYLYALTVLVCVLITTATGTYSYPETLGAIRGPLIWVHDISGDLAILVTILYLWNHLSRTWKMKRLVVSRYTGMLVVGGWTLAGLTGIYGQVITIQTHSAIWWLHVIPSIAIIIIACFHGAWAYRPSNKSDKSDEEEVPS